MEEKWIVYNKKADFKEIGKKFGIDPVTARILRNRGIWEEDDVRLFLQGSLKDLYDPHLLKDVEVLTDILKEKIRTGKSIRVIGDYDIDGVMASCIWIKGLQNCGAQVSAQIPHRIADGYGLNRNLIKEAGADGVDTILTCDNGIAALEEIALAKEMGITVLVTDHHEIPFAVENGIKVEKRSLADAIVNPRQQDCRYPNKELCGAAVAWKVICVLYEKMGRDREETEEFLENVAFATVGDVMTLTGENRILVKEGIKRIHQTKNIGMKALISQCGVEQTAVDAYHFGYVLGPCINASGRLDTAKRALRLFFEQDEACAVQRAKELVSLNEERKQMTTQGVEEAKRVCEEQGFDRDKVIVVYLPDVHESIAGIIAGRIRESYHRPAFILTNGAEGVKGSGRSIEVYSMYEELCKCGDLLDKFGGHRMAAGLSLPAENVGLLRKRLNENCALSEEEMAPRIYIDVPMPVDYVTMDLCREFKRLAPFGKDNERPVFADRNVRVIRMWLLGQNRNVLRLTMQSQNKTDIAAIYFGDIDRFLQYLHRMFGEDDVENAFRGKENRILLSVIYQPAVHVFRGEESLQFEIRHYRAAEP